MRRVVRTQESGEDNKEVRPRWVRGQIPCEDRVHRDTRVPLLRKMLGEMPWQVLGNCRGKFLGQTSRHHTVKHSKLHARTKCARFWFPGVEGLAFSSCTIEGLILSFGTQSSSNFLSTFELRSRIAFHLDSFEQQKHSGKN
jgi:hypothetical protein